MDFPASRQSNTDGFPRIMRCLFHLKPPYHITCVTFQRFSPYHFDREKYGLMLVPWPDYRFLYPAETMRLEKIATISTVLVWFLKTALLHICRPLSKPSNSGLPFGSRTMSSSNMRSARDL